MPTSSDAVVEVEHVTKLYELGALASLSRSVERIKSALTRREFHRESLCVLDDVSFDVRRGECFACLGRNGSGKSTLLSIIADVTLPTSGCVRIHGRVVPLLHVDSGFHQDLTGRENVVMLGTILGLRGHEIDDALPRVRDFAEMDEAHLNTPIGRWSTGQQSRLAFATALSLPAEVYILDEVLAAADDHFKHKCVDAVEDLVRRGKTVMFVSHELELVRRICTRGLWMHEGEVRALGDIADVAAAYEAADAAL